ncbi:MAG: nitrate reductase molybdenum cofactor assembly chaperone [Streptosporangiales bacterium]|nr:nitrate reductase molybdenum cofactor assembly chaperone [Streptosporangiales bacterium]
MTAKVSVDPFKIASVLLQYPTVALFDGLSLLKDAASGCDAEARDPFGLFLEWMEQTPPDEVARHYVETFDLKRRCALYLTYYRYGDTRKRGMAMVRFKAAYRAAGLMPFERELPDYLPMVLDFAAADPRGVKLLREHRADLELLLRALRETASPYEWVIEGVCACLPKLRRPDKAVIERLTETGPPAEDVGLEPFAPPDYLGGFRGVVPPGQHSLGASR